MRHLYETGSTRTLCGAGVRCDRHSHVWAWDSIFGASPSRVAVHASHARRSDCRLCRRGLRRSVWRARAHRLRTSARMTEFDSVAWRLMAQANLCDARAELLR